MKTPKSLWEKYAYLWLTLGFFLFSLVGHWLFGWFAYVEDAKEHAQAVQVSSYLTEMGRDTFENWQSEFLQLMWHVAGLAYFFYVGSPQSREGDERKEAKLDLIIRKLDSQNGDDEIKKLDTQYVRS